jgi:hypothetical protein
MEAAINLALELPSGDCQTGPDGASRICGAASQSSIGWSGEPGRAIDGNTDTEWSGGSCSHTDDVASGSAWFQLDLGRVALIDRVAVYHRTDCCQDRLESALLMVSETPDFTTGIVCGQISDHSQEPELSQCGGAAEGRFITVDLAAGGGGSSSGAYITICEIEVWGLESTQTIAFTDLVPDLLSGDCHTGPDSASRICGAASQSSIGWSGEPGRAIDGNTDTEWSGGSCSHTDDVASGSAWFQLDLGQHAIIDRVAVYHRTDCCQDRLESAHIYVSDTTDIGSGVKCGEISDHTQEPEIALCGGAAAGQYVTIDLAGGGGGSSSGAYITICEIQVYGLYHDIAIKTIRDLVPSLHGADAASGAACYSTADGARVCGDVSQSSIGWSGEPDRAIDGNTATEWSGGSCSHTDDVASGSAWFQLDLGDIAVIDRVEVYLGLGRIVALYYRSSTSYQNH